MPTRKPAKKTAAPRQRVPKSEDAQKPKAGKVAAKKVARQSADPGGSLTLQQMGDFAVVAKGSLTKDQEAKLLAFIKELEQYGVISICEKPGN